MVTNMTMSSAHPRDSAVDVLERARLQYNLDNPAHTCVDQPDYPCTACDKAFFKKP